MPADPTVAALLAERASAGQKRILAAVASLASRLEAPTYMVGGAVRDLLKTGKLKDLDFVVEGDGLALARLLAQELEARVKTHERFLTAEIWSTEFRLDVVSARSEVYGQPAGLPTVTSGSLEDDLARRDFTVNAMAVTLWPAGRDALIDPFEGRRDLEQGWLRILHEHSFFDDPTRILRGVRLGSRLGLQLEPATDALAVAAIESGALTPLSADRLRRELILLLEESRVRASLHDLERLGFFEILGRSRTISPAEWEAVQGIAELRTHWRTGEPPMTEVRWWLAFLMSLYIAEPPSSRSSLAARVGLDDGLRRIFMDFPDRIDRVMSSLSDSGIEPHTVSEIVGELTPEELVLVVATAGGQAHAWLENWLEEVGLVRLRIGGGDLINEGFPPGPEIGVALQATLDARMDDIIGPDEELGFAIRQLMGERSGGES